jgi:hypothetical protein
MEPLYVALCLADPTVLLPLPVWDTATSFNALRSFAHQQRLAFTCFFDHLRLHPIQ